LGSPHYEILEEQYQELSGHLDIVGGQQSVDLTDPIQEETRNDYYEIRHDAGIGELDMRSILPQLEIKPT